MVSQKTMVLLVGPTGSGKSTFRKEHLSDWPCISPDAFIVGRWTPVKCGSAWTHAHETALEMLKDGDSFCVDAQFVDPATRKQWITLAKGFGFRTVGLIFITPWRQLLKNQAARGSRGHYGTIPFKVQRARYQEFKKQLRPKLDRWAEMGLPFDYVHFVKWGEKFRFYVDGIL